MFTVTIVTVPPGVTVPGAKEQVADAGSPEHAMEIEFVKPPGPRGVISRM